MFVSLPAVADAANLGTFQLLTGKLAGHANASIGISTHLGQSRTPKAQTCCEKEIGRKRERERESYQRSRKA
jgi:hypothetical protein